MTKIVLPPDDHLAQFARYFPIKSGTKDTPLLKGWQRKGLTREQLVNKADLTPSNFAVNVGASGLLVVDIDKGGMAGWNALCEANGGVPDTYVATTPNAGYHLVFTGPPTANTAGKLAANVDSRGAAGYIMAPNSVVNGKQYKVLHNRPIAAAPQWLIDAIGAKREREADPLDLDLDLPGAIDRATDYLVNTAPTAIEGEAGDTTTYTVACQVREFGISEARCLQLMLDYWNEAKAVPSWDAEELERKVQNAYDYATAGLGSDQPPEAVFDTIPMPDPPPIARHEDIYLSGDMPKGKRPPTKWILPGWLPDDPINITLFGGRGGVGKSTLAAQLAAAVVTGRQWLGIDVEQQMPAFLVLCEDSPHQVWGMLDDLREPGFYPDLDYDQKFCAFIRNGVSRMVQMDRGGNPQRAPFDKLLREQLTWFRQGHLKGHVGPILLVLDTAADIFGGNNCDVNHVTFLVKETLRTLAVDHDVRVVLLIHPAKDVESEYAGSAAWHDAVRNRWFMGFEDPNDPENSPLHIKMSKFNWGQMQEPITLKRIAGSRLFIQGDRVKMLNEIDNAVLLAVIEAADKKRWLSGSAKSGSRCIWKNRRAVRINNKFVYGDVVKNSYERLVASGALVTKPIKGCGNCCIVTADNILDSIDD